MFCFLVDNIFLDFWYNALGDIFLDATIKGLKLDKTKLRVIYFPDLIRYEFFVINEDNSIAIQEKNITIDEFENEIVTYNTVKTIEGVLYYENGTMFINC